MRVRRWLIPALSLAVGSAVVYYGVRRGYFRRLSENMRTYSMPSAKVYDAFSVAFTKGFHARVAREMAAISPSGSLLDVGPGPGRLEMHLARAAPHMRITGVDIAPAMVTLANRRAQELGLADRVRFEVGDVGALPFPERSFDAVVSTLAFHHFHDPVRALTEVYRVLKPGGVACIYDLADEVLRATHHGRGLQQALAESPFRDGAVETFRWPGPLPLFKRLCLVRSPRDLP